MTVKIEVECDALYCSNSVEIDNLTDADIAHAGYHTDPRHGEYHYCSKCWPKVKDEVLPED